MMATVPSAVEPTPVAGEEPSRRRRRLVDDRSLLAVLAVTALWIAVMYLHVWRRHDRFATFDHDLGFHDHYIWLLARGRAFSTVLGLRAFGHNATFGYLLFAPLSWIGFGPQSLDLVATVAVGAGAPALFLLGRHRIGDDRLAAAAAGAYLLHPVAQLDVWETWHPELMAIVPLIAAELCARRQRWRPMAMWLCFAAVWKTDISLAIVMFGMLLVFRGHRRRGGVVVGLAALWFVVCGSVIVPSQADGETVYGSLFGDLGDTPAEVAKTAVTDPGKVLSRLEEHEPDRYGRDLAAPYALVPVLAPGALLLGLPQATINLLSYANFTWDFRLGPHYQTLPLVALSIATVDALAFLRRRRASWAGPAAAVVLAASAGTTAAWGALWPITDGGNRWARDGDPQRAAVEEAIRLIGPDAAVSAPYSMVPHLTHRDVVYVYPNPWISSYYVDKTPPDVTKVRFVVVNPDTVPPDGPERELWDCLRTSPAWTQRMDDHSIVLLEQVGNATDDRTCQQES